MTYLQRAVLAATMALTSLNLYATETPMPVDEPGMLTLLLGGGVIAAVLAWRNRRKK